MQSLLIEIHTENCFCKAFGHVAYELQVVHTWELYKLKIPSWIKMTSSVKSSFTRGLSRRKIESVFRHFTKFNLRKTDSSQNSIWEKRTLHKIQYEKNGPFTKFNMRKTDPSQNSIWEKRTFTKFNVRKTDSSQNSVWEKLILHKI